VLINALSSSCCVCQIYIDHSVRVTQHYEYHVFITFTATSLGRLTRPSSDSRTNS